MHLEQANHSTAIPAMEYVVRGSRQTVIAVATADIRMTAAGLGAATRIAARDWRGQAAITGCTLGRPPRHTGANLSFGLTTGASYVTFRGDWHKGGSRLSPTRQRTA